MTLLGLILSLILIIVAFCIGFISGEDWMLTMIRNKCSYEDYRNILTILDRKVEE